VTVVLTYQGSTAHRQEAEAELRRSFPGVRLTRKTSSTIEAELAPDQVRSVAALGLWNVAPIVYADADPPKVNFSRLRNKLAGRK